MILKQKPCENGRIMTLEYLLENSGLPGPRGNLALLYQFTGQAEPSLVEQCLGLIKPDTANSPQEFAGMCGVVGQAVLKKSDLPAAIAGLRPYASHASWRIREAVAIAIQEIASSGFESILAELDAWSQGNALEQRAVVAALCEPKLLKNPKTNQAVLKLMERISYAFPPEKKLASEQLSLRKTLGYGWSVLIVNHPAASRPVFETLAISQNPNLLWIVRENLGKSRLVKMDADWVEGLKTKI